MFSLHCHWFRKSFAINHSKYSQRYLLSKQKLIEIFDKLATSTPNRELRVLRLFRGNNNKITKSISQYGDKRRPGAVAAVTEYQPSSAMAEEDILALKEKLR